MSGGSVTPDTPSSTHTAILDASLDVLARVGIAKLALEEVASTAGVSRQTVYRHFGSRDGLLSAVIVREEELLLDLVDEATEGVEEIEEAVRVGLAAALHGADEHPLLQRLLTSEPEALLPFLTLGSGPVLSIIGPAIAAVVQRRAAHLDGADLDFLGDMLGRVVVSYAISPREDVPGGDVIDDTAARLAEMVAAHVRRLEG